MIRRNLEAIRVAARLDLHAQGVAEPSDRTVAALVRRKCVMGRGALLGLDHLPGVVRCSVVSGRDEGLADRETLLDVRVDGVSLEDVREHVAGYVLDVEAVLVRVRPARLVDYLIAWLLWQWTRVTARRS